MYIYTSLVKRCPLSILALKQVNNEIKEKNIDSVNS